MGEDDRRGLAYVCLTEGAIQLDAGRAKEAVESLMPGLLLSQELDEPQLVTRFLSQLAAAHSMQHSTTTAIEFGLQALANAREQKDKYSEAVSAANLGIAFRPTAPGPTSRPNRTQPQPALRPACTPVAHLGQALRHH